MRRPSLPPRALAAGALLLAAACAPPLLRSDMPPLERPRDAFVRELLGLCDDTRGTAAGGSTALSGAESGRCRAKASADTVPHKPSDTGKPVVKRP